MPHMCRQGTKGRKVKTVLYYRTYQFENRVSHINPRGGFKQVCDHDHYLSIMQPYGNNKFIYPWRLAFLVIFLLKIERVTFSGFG